MAMAGSKNNSPELLSQDLEHVEKIHRNVKQKVGFCSGLPRRVFSPLPPTRAEIVTSAHREETSPKSGTHNLTAAEGLASLAGSAGGTVKGAEHISNFFIASLA